MGRVQKAPPVNTELSPNRLKILHVKESGRVNLPLGPLALYPAVMQSWKIIIRYDGARYKGWQRLGKDAAGETIQSKIEAVFSTLCGEETLVTGSGRTDAGVHAFAQPAHFRTEAELNPEMILNHAARYLPDDIAVVHAEKTDERFHARYRVVEKTYLYRIDTGLWPDPFERKYAWHVPEPLNFKDMAAAGTIFSGRHDFKAFTTMKSKTKSAERDLKTVDICEPSGDNSILEIRLSADGFLHNMVRIIVGTLIEVGLGGRPVGSVSKLLDGGKRADAGKTAPAKGLFLESVKY